MEWVFRGFKIGRIAGVTVRVHWSLLLLIAFQLPLYWRIGPVFALAVLIGGLISLVIHELGHVAGARFCGGYAEEILLWPLGGLTDAVAPRHPTAGFITSVCGPLATGLLWLVLAGLALLPVPDQVASVLKILGAWNLFLLIFNLIPMYPLDGGRMLRDALWHRLTLLKSAEITMWVSRFAAGGVFAYGLTFSNSMLCFLAVLAVFHNVRPEQLMEGLRHGWDRFSLRDRMRETMPRIVIRRSGGPVNPRENSGRGSSSSPAAAPGKTLTDASKPRKVPVESGTAGRKKDAGAVVDPMREVDRILEKISREGISSLSEEEREKLRKASRDL